jgi:hypothetical protein
LPLKNSSGNTSEIALFAEERADLMIERGWMEEPPQSPNRQKLINDK